MNLKSANTRKNGNDSILRGLPQEQQAKVEGWLFDDRKTYKQVAELCLQEFKLELSTATLSRYWQTRGREREAAKAGAGAGAEPKTPQERYEAVLDEVERLALALAQCSPDKVKARDLAPLVNLLIGARREANEACRLALAREKLEYDVATACLVHKIGMDRICEDRTLNEGERIRAIREELFGEKLPE